MITYLIAYVCATAAMDDCQVYAAKSWSTPVECEQAKPDGLARLQADYRKFYIRVECETE